MAMYESFARVYDRFMDNVPYDDWAKVLQKILTEHEIRSGLVLDLGCGTGQMTRRLRDMGYDMIGVDGSEDMLEIALEEEKSADAEKAAADAEKAGEKHFPILYLMQDMREFELYGTVRAIVSCCDCMNYIGTEEDLLQVFSLVRNYLDPDGIFIFDTNTEHYYKDVLGQNTFADVRDECSIIWENAYYPGDRENEYDLTIFVREKSGLYRRTRETHFEKAWRTDEIRRLAEKAGLVFEKAGAGYSDEEPGQKSERLLWIFRKPQG